MTLAGLVSPLTNSMSLSGFGRSPKSRQGPDSAAGETSHIPCRSPKPRAIGRISSITEATAFSRRAPRHPPRTAALPQPIGAGNGRSWPGGAVGGRCCRPLTRRDPFMTSVF